jgi:5-methylcytosine-specific restriction endonuclease McrBC GTP-binding regulatory subunit McrB
MNLAHVELYFRDLLSKLESRRGRDVEQIEVDLGAGLHKHRVDLTRNVLWVGTMNEDETTKTLSDKVLDRGNVIIFPRPRALERRKTADLAEERARLPWEAWRQWTRPRSTFTDEQIQDYKSLLEEMNLRLERAGRALGHRVWQSIEHYMANHPGVIAAQDAGDEEALRRGMRTAFEDQLVQKVMPKLRGIETSGRHRTECLDPIKSRLAEFDGLRLQDDFDLACSTGYGGFVWNSARYLEADE